MYKRTKCVVLKRKQRNNTSTESEERNDESSKHKTATIIRIMKSIFDGKVTKKNERKHENYKNEWTA